MESQLQTKLRLQYPLPVKIPSSLHFQQNPCKDSSVIVSFSSVATTPGSILVTLMLERALNSCLKPSLNAATANLVAQYTLPPAKTTLPATDERLTMCPDFLFFHM